MNRRHFLAAGLAAPIVWWGRDAFAGSYLDRAALLLNGARAERDMAVKRYQDKELLRVAHEVAKARAASARQMDVPKVVAPAHPHLLLVLENSERGLAAALEGEHQRFLQHILRARSEDRTFRALVKKMGYTLPDT